MPCSREGNLRRRNLLYNRTSTADFTQLVTKFQPRSLASPFRSTVPLLSLVREDCDAFDVLLGRCGIEGDISLHFEYEVESPGASGNPSQTDLMVISQAAALAIEAKWTEPRYETVAARLNRERDQSHAEAFVSGWLGLLQPHARRKLHLGDFNETVYQMVHRAASACATSASPRMVYLHFRLGLDFAAREEPNYADDLARLHALLGHPRTFPFFLVEVNLEPLEPFDGLTVLKKGSEETENAVRSAICAGGLFDFAIASIDTVGP